MQTVKRGELLAKLNEASVGLSARELTDRSDSFVIYKGTLYTFNESVLTRAPAPIKGSGAVLARDLLGILERFPDDELQVGFVGSDLHVKGRGRRAGISCYDASPEPVKIPKPKHWIPMREHVWAAIQRAAKICGTDLSQYLTTCVHVTDGLVEACDNFRWVRTRCKTRFDREMLIPGKSVADLAGVDIHKMATTRGCLHLLTHSGTMISIRCSEEPYHADIAKLGVMAKDAVAVRLPVKLKDIVRRAQLFDARVVVDLTTGRLKMTSRKDGGWYREVKKLKYRGPDMRFRVQADLLLEMLEYSGHEVSIDEKKLRVVMDKTLFVASVLPPEREPKRKKTAPEPE